MQHANTRSSSLHKQTDLLHTAAHVVVIPNCHPFVKWAGGKTQLLSKLQRYSPQGFNQYFEPFLGGGAFFFYLVSVKHLQFSAVYISDVNAELINAYKVIKDNVEQLIELLRVHKRKYEKGPREYYYALRAAEIKQTNDVERAARFITLNKTCFNGLYRVNKNGKFNVPLGRYKNPIICDSENLRNVSLALRHSMAHISVNSYKDVLLQNACSNDDFVYLDPPYQPMSSTANFTAYTHNGFSDQDQRELYDIFKELDKRGCKVLLSNSDTPFIRELYHEYRENTVEVPVLRAINSKGTKRAGHRELLIRNYSSS